MEDEAGGEKPAVGEGDGSNECCIPLLDCGSDIAKDIQSEVQVEVKKAFDTVAEVVDARLDQAVRQATQRLELLMKKLDAAAKPQARVCLKMGTPKPNGLSSLIVNIRIKASHSCVSPFSDPQIFDQFHSVRFPHG